MSSLLLHWLLNAAALWVAAWLLPGLDFTGTVVQLLLVAAVFGIVNSLIRPILTVLTCPLIVVTLGLFTLVINALMLMLTGWVAERLDLGFHVEGFWTAVLGAIVITVATWILDAVVPDKDCVVNKGDHSPRGGKQVWFQLRVPRETSRH